MKKEIKTISLAKIIRHAKASGTNIEQRMMMDSAKLALKKKMKNRKKQSWTIIEIIFMIARQLIVLRI